MTRVKRNTGPAEDDDYLRRALRLAWSLPSADFYAPADMRTAKRIGGIVWLTAWLVIVLLLPIAPPKEHVGDAGWIFVAVPLLGTPEKVAANELLLFSYLALANLALLTWLGGADSPYPELFVLGVLYTCAVHP